jgi:hypothetical protein
MYLRVNLHLWVDRDPQLVRQGAGHHHAPLLHHAPELKNNIFKGTASRDTVIVLMRTQELSQICSF